MRATQEILIKIVTNLSTFRGESSFDTWVYRVSTNSLLTTRKVIQKERGLTFHLFQQDLQSGLVIDPSPPAEDVVLLNALRVSCTMAMGRVSDTLIYSGSDTPDYAVARREAAQAIANLKAVTLQRATGAFKCPTDLAATLIKILAPPG
ncbi:MAG: hypothetical protein WCC57_12485 [Paracoccaceae bacterium]